MERFQAQVRSEKIKRICITSNLFLPFCASYLSFCIKIATKTKKTQYLVNWKIISSCTIKIPHENKYKINAIKIYLTNNIPFCKKAICLRTFVPCCRIKVDSELKISSKIFHWEKFQRTSYNSSNYTSTKEVSSLNIMLQEKNIYLP